MAESSVRGPNVVVAVGAGALVAGSFFPWVTVSSAFGELNANGIDGDGKITAVCGAIVGLLVLVTLTKRSRTVFVIGLIAAGIGGATAIYDWNNVSKNISGLSSDYASAKVGTGLYLCIGGAAVGVIGCIVGLSQSSGRATTLSPATPQPFPPTMKTTTATPTSGWFPDPSGRHQFRFWSGQLWTEHVTDNGQPFTDPL